MTDIERRKRLRESAMRIADQYNLGAKRQKIKPATMKTLRVETGFYDGIQCKMCGAPVEKTGRQGRPPSKCLKHR